MRKKRSTYCRPNKPLKGRVEGITQTNNRMTCSVTVYRLVHNKDYKKLLTRTKKYLVEDPKSLTEYGDWVSFIPCKPISKRIRHKVSFRHNKR